MIESWQERAMSTGGLKVLRLTKYKVNQRIIAAVSFDTHTHTHTGLLVPTDQPPSKRTSQSEVKGVAVIGSRPVPVRDLVAIHQAAAGERIY